MDGIPVLLVEPGAADHDELGHVHRPAGHKDRQARYFDRDVAAEFEIRRPHGSPALYRWMLGEKFRRSIEGIEAVVASGTALTVCGGSGMDAQFLAEAGARVLVSDLSLEAAKRARKRADRFGLSIEPIVADVERLPFADRSVDVVYVHDGLHHLENPAVGLREMARVSAVAVSVTEPADALVTALAVRVGLALAEEEAGNRVARLKPHDVTAILAGEGLHPLRAERYAMYYRHEPGRIVERLSRPRTLGPTVAAWRLANRLIGRVGNKLAVVATRNAPSEGHAAP